MAAPFSFSPLFRMASREIRDAARREFGASQFGKLLRETHRASTAMADSGDKIRQAIERYGRSMDPARAARDLMGVDFRSFAHEIQRYALGGGMGRDLIRSFLGSMGPVGSVIWSLASGTKKPGKLDSSLQAAVDLLESFGFEVLPPPGKKKLAIGDVNAGISKAVEFLRQVGYPISTGEDELTGPPHRDAGSLPFGISPFDKNGRPRKSIAIDGMSGHRRYKVDDPIVTGEMVDVTTSTNVHSIGYDIEAKYLYVRFIAREAKRDLKPDQMPPHIPGPLYRYRDVPEDMFRALLRDPHKGEWLWENIRIKGTVSGHRKDYELVGVTGGYVPRKATFGESTALGIPGPSQFGEFYVPRQVWSTQGRTLTSVLPLEIVAAFNPRTTGPQGPTGPRGPSRSRS